MGRGQIISGGENGQYQVKLIYANRSRVESKISQLQTDKTAIDARITALDALIAAETDQKKRESYILERSVLRLQSVSIAKQIEYYQNGMPADPTQSAWCMDLTEDLSGVVGTAEIPGEDALVLIRPGYDGRASYLASRDGQLMPAIAGSAHQVLFNWMLLPGWQRHKPIYRAGTIVPDSIDFDANTCSVCLDAAYSSQQSLPAIDGAAVGDCNMGDDDQSEYLTAAAEDFCSRNPGHPFCVQGEGSEIAITAAQLAELRSVNWAVNFEYGRANDASGFVVGDNWDVMSPGGSGDCEDFALTKMQKLVDDYGWSPDDLKIVTAYARNGEYHAMLGVRTSNRGLVILDVNYDEVMEAGRVPYRIDKIALASDTWKNYTRRLDAVPIEYMTCNAAAFADGDRVVVEFTNQSWSSPKVIGFLESPQPCGLDIVYVMGRNGNWTWEGSWSFLKYYTASDSWVGNENIPGDYLNGEEWGGDPTYAEPTIRNDFFFSASSNQIFLFGGIGQSSIEYYPQMYLNRSDRRDNASGSWTELQSLTARRAIGQGFAVGGNYYVVSGGQYNYLVEIEGGTFEGRLGDIYTDTYMYSNDSDSWMAKMDVTHGGLQNRSFVIDGIAFFILGFGSSQWHPGGLDSYFPPSYKPASWMPDTFLGYNYLANSWAAYQDMLRGGADRGAANISGNGYVGPGICSGAARSGDEESFYVIGGDEMNPPQILHLGWSSNYIDKYDKNSDSWSIVTREDEDNSGESNMTGGVNQKSTVGYGYFAGGWKSFDPSESTFALLEQRPYLSLLITANGIVGF